MADPAAHVVLVGLPGSGKSVVGRRLARALDRPFLDLDVAIARRAGMTVQAIFAAHGEDYFRELEQELTREIAADAGTVIAPGGGWITRADTVALLRPPGLLVYLRSSVDCALTRMGKGIGRRPLLAGGDAHGRLERLLDERASAYESADFTVGVDGLPVTEVVHRVLTALRSVSARAPGVPDAAG